MEDVVRTHRRVEPRLIPVDDTPERFSQLLETVLPRAQRAALYLTQDPEEAEDVVHDAVLYALRGFSSFETGTNFQAWFMTILTNSFYMRCRKAKRNRESVSFDDAPAVVERMRSPSGSLRSHVEAPDTAFQRRRTQQRIREAIGELPTDYRIVASLFFLEQWKYGEIAKKVGCPVGTVRSRLFRARELLRGSLAGLAADYNLTVGMVDEAVAA